MLLTILKEKTIIGNVDSKWIARKEVKYGTIRSISSNLWFDRDWKS